MVFYTLVHLGVTRIVTVGWDIADASGSNAHFDQRRPDRTPASLRLRFRAWAKHRLGRFGLFRPVQILVQRARHRKALRAYREGQLCYPAIMQPGEAQVVASSIQALTQWLAEEGVRLEIRSNSPWMAPRG